jgi:hypothetical protein
VPTTISACSTTWRRAKSGRQRAELSAGPDDDGYFLLLASPQIKAERDRAAGEDGDLCRRPFGQHERQEDGAGPEALKFVLNNLREGDTFNIVAYDSSVEAFRPELQRSTTRRARRRWGSSRASTPAAARTSTGR